MKEKRQVEIAPPARSAGAFAIPKSPNPEIPKSLSYV